MMRLFQGSSAGKQAESSDSRGMKRKRSESVEDHVPILEERPDEAGIPGDGNDEPRESTPMVPALVLLPLNSSNQLPSRSAVHNLDMVTGSRVAHILQLPAAVMNRILSEVLITNEPYDVCRDGHIKPKKSHYHRQIQDNQWVPAAEVVRKPGILEVCKSIREQALPIFYVGNSFVLDIQDFDAKVFEDWWRRRMYHITQAQRYPIHIAHADQSKAPSHYELCVARGSLLPPTLYSPRANRDLKMTRKRPFSIFHLQQGTIQMQVQYKPHWVNLSDWLCLYHEGLLPPLEVSNGSPELSRVAAIFASVGAYKGSFEWEVAAKGLDGHRKVLIADSAEWGLEKGAVMYGSDDEPTEDASSQTLRGDTQMDRDMVPLEPLDFDARPPVYDDLPDAQSRDQSPTCENEKPISISDDDDDEEDDFGQNVSRRETFSAEMKKNLAKASIQRKALSSRFNPSDGPSLFGEDLPSGRHNTSQVSASDMMQDIQRGKVSVAGQKAKEAGRMLKKRKTTREQSLEL